MPYVTPRDVLTLRKTGQENGWSFSLDRSVLPVGSHTGCEIHIPDLEGVVPEIAGHLIKVDGAYHFRHLSGAVLHNGAPVEEDVEIHNGDVLKIGEFEAELKKSDLIGYVDSTEILDPSAPDAADPVGAIVSVGPTQRLVGPEQSITIGSAIDCDIILDEDRFVSAHHARIRAEPEGRWSLVDLGSTNGTFVGGFRIKEIELPTNRSVFMQIGESRVVFDAIRTSENDVLPGLIGESRAVQKLAEVVKVVAQAESPVLISGPTGSGKELVARAVHGLSGRRKTQLVPVNVGALSPTLLLSELFGHTKGAFTGANSQREGLFEAANGSTLFLDEIGEISLEAQAALLRTLEDGTVRRMGDNKEVQTDVRLISATHKDLHAMAAEGTFRQDLYHRISTLQVDVPALCDRDRDVVILANHFAAKHTGCPLTLTARAEEKLLGYSWPGNVRELRNVIERAIVHSQSNTIDSKDLRFDGMPAQSVETLAARLQQEDKHKIAALLMKYNGQQNLAAKELGMSPSGFRSKAKRLGLLQGPSRRSR